MHAGIGELKMRVPRLFLIAFFLMCAPAAAQTTILNADSNGNPILHHTTANNMLGLHSPSMVQVGDTFYWYSDHYDCGFILGTASPWCGFEIYSTKDFVNWIDLGQPFDSTASYWQTRCGANGVGCYGIMMAYNPVTTKYVFWFNGPAIDSDNPQGEYAFICDTPTGPCTQQRPGPSHLTSGPVGDGAVLYTSVSGTGYVLYNDGGWNLHIDQLNADYTDSLGTNTTAVGIGLGEAGSISERNGTVMVTYGVACAYCANAAAGVIYASSILGTYSGATILNSTACSGQQSGIWKLDTPAGDQYIWGSNQWNSLLRNQSLATQIFVKMTFTGSAVDPFSCPATTTLAGLTLNPPGPPSPTPDQTDVQDGYTERCDTNGPNWNMQTFTPSVTPLDRIYFDLFQNNGVCTSGTCPTNVGANLTVSLYAVDGSNNPTGPALATATIVSTTVPWGPTWTSVPLSYPVTAGAHYGVVFSAPGIASNGSQGCYGRYVYLGGSPAPYTAGVHRHSTDSGVTWTTVSNASMMFSTFPPTASVGGGRRLR